jgi:hypothetical protein
MFLGLLNMENFSMHHTIGMSYTSWSGQGIMLGTYTNSMFYKFSEDFDIQVDASLVTSPYSSFGQQFNNDISGLYISRAALNYKISEDAIISVQYINPVGSFYPYGYSRFGNSPFGFYSPYYYSLPSGLNRN